LPSFPYKPADWPADKIVTKADWDALSADDQYNLTIGPALAEAQPNILNKPSDLSI
jgi:hypothetical protein